MAEKEKRRATTFVTSRGAIINVAAPLVYIPPGVTPVDVTSPAELGEALEEKGVTDLRLIDYLKDVGEYSSGSIVSLVSEGIPILGAFAGGAQGPLSGYALKVTVPAGGSVDLWVGKGVARQGVLYQIGTFFYLQNGLNATVNWAVGSDVNREEEATVFRVSYEGKGNWNHYLRPVPTEQDLTVWNWFKFALTNPTGSPLSIYVARTIFGAYADGKYPRCDFSGYIPIIQASYYTPILLELYAGWMGVLPAHIGFIGRFSVQSDGVNAMDTRLIIYRDAGIQSISELLGYVAAVDSGAYIKRGLIDNRAWRNLGACIQSRIAGGGKGYIRRAYWEFYLNEAGLPLEERYVGSSVTTDNDGDTDTFTILDYTTEPLPCQYAEIDHVEIEVTGTSGVAHIEVDGNRVHEDIAIGGGIKLEELSQVEKLTILASDAGTGATTVTYRIYYKLMKALLWRSTT